MTDQELIDHVVSACLEPMRGKLNGAIGKYDYDTLWYLLDMTEDAETGMYADLLKADVALQIADKRKALFRASFPPRTLIAVTLLCDQPAEIVLYMSYAAWCAQKKGRLEIDLSWFLSRVIPNGVASREDKSRLWEASQYVDAQGSRANGLDNRAVIAFLNSTLTA